VGEGTEPGRCIEDRFWIVWGGGKRRGWGGWYGGHASTVTGEENTWLESALGGLSERSSSTLTPHSYIAFYR
jgi:hypothetical protein